MKILVVLSDDMFIRNYLTTGAFEKLEQEHEVVYLASDKVSIEKLKDNPRFWGSYHFEEWNENQHYAYFNVLMWHYRNRSPSFQFRFKRLLKLGLLKHRKFRQFAKAYISPQTSPLYCMAWGTMPLWKMNPYIPMNQGLAKAITTIDPELIIYPSSAYDPDGNDIARISKILHVKTLFLIDNWDNLSSKTIFWAFPDHLGVWGEQSKEHAIRIQGFKPEQVTPIGTPRFDEYYNHMPPSPFDFKYVLFVGQAIPFDELTALRRLEWEIEFKPLIYRGLKVIYRPHPWRQSRLCYDRFEQSQFKHVIIDPQVKDAYDHKNGKFQPDLSYYPALVKNAKFVISTPTTMLIESLICKRRVLLLAYDDGIHLTTPSNSLANYEHFKGVDRIDGVRMCKTLDSLPYLFMMMDREDSWAFPDISHYLFNDGRPYRDRLADLVRGLDGQKT